MPECSAATVDVAPDAAAAQVPFKGPQGRTMSCLDTMNHQEVFETARPSQLAAPSARPRPRLFGQFLVAQGAIGETDVNEALQLMRLVNSPVGEIAIGEGLLSRDQVDTILAAQRHIDGHFFELAASLGLGGQELEALCADQAIENLRFGDALVEVGAISSTALEEHLRVYEAEEHYATPMLSPGSTVLARCVADLLPRLARRALSTSVRFSSGRAWTGEAHDVHATATVRGQGGVSLGLSVEDVVANRLGPRRRTAATAWARQLAPLLLADFVGLTMNMALQKMGTPRDGTLAPGELPVRGICFDIAFESGGGLLVIDAG